VALQVLVGSRCSVRLESLPDWVVKKSEKAVCLGVRGEYWERIRLQSASD
jgi:hypothetical protein